MTSSLRFPIYSWATQDDNLVNQKLAVRLLEKWGDYVAKPIQPQNLLKTIARVVATTV